MMTWISDGGHQVVAINITDSQGSNRSCCADRVELEFGSDGTVSARFDASERDWLRYRFHGTTDAGVYVVEVDEGGGSGIFGTLLLLNVDEEVYLQRTVARDLIEEEAPALLWADKRELHLRRIGTVLLGDRGGHTIDIAGDAIVIDGVKIDMPSL